MKTLSKICLVCGTKFVLKKYRISYKDGREIERYSGQKYCSQKCKARQTFLEHHSYYQNYWLTRPYLWRWKKERECKQCGNKFIPNNPRQIGCSKSCSKRFTRKSWKKRNWKTVLSSQRKDYAKKIEKKLATILVKRPCKQCGKDFIPDRKHYAQQLYCSYKCQQKWCRKWENKTEYGKAKKRHDVVERAHRVRANGGKFTFQEWEQMKKDYNFTCPICKRKEPEIKLTRDHITPIVKGGIHSKENIQPLCISCNCRKHDN